MKKMLKSIIAASAGTLVWIYVARLRRSRAMDRKVHQLQERFRGLDTPGESMR